MTGSKEKSASVCNEEFTRLIYTYKTCHIRLYLYDRCLREIINYEIQYTSIVGAYKKDYNLKKVIQYFIASLQFETNKTIAVNFTLLN